MVEVWPVLWIVTMVGFIVALIVVAVMEQKTRQRAALIAKEQAAVLQQATGGMSENQDPNAMPAGDFGGFGNDGFN